MNKMLLSLLVSMFLCGALHALEVEAVPFTNAEIEQANQYLKKSEHRDKLCVGGKKIAGIDGIIYMAKCRTDSGNYFAVGFAAFPGKEWKIETVLPITDKD